MAGADSVLTIAALGRPFHLGSLYDIRSDQIIAGVTLWNKEALEGKIHEQNIWNSAYEIITSDNMHDKTSALDISGNLNLSILGGLVEAGGSAKYLENKKKSGREERVTLQYKCSTKARELTMDHLGPGNIMHPYIMDKGIATHVVTGIEYGANAFFVFDRTYELSESGKIISGNLFAVIKKIPKILANIDGEIKYDSSDQELTKEEAIKCKFCGDFYLERNPSTYQEAVHIYKELPSLLGKNGEKAVPIRVTLFPLAQLDTRASQIVREISNHLVSDTEKLLETVYEMQSMCNDLLQYEAAMNFPRIKKEVSEFESLIQAFKRGMQSKLSRMLPAIRGGGQEEATLADLLQKWQLSPFSTSSLLAWARRQEEQMKILSGYIQSLHGTTLASGTGDLQAMVLELETRDILCLIILVPQLTAQLETMRKYLQIMDTDQESPEFKALGNLACSRIMNVRSFKDFVNINKDDTKTKFVVMEESCNTEELCAVVRYYKDGQCVSENYEVPSAPGSAEINDDDTCHDQVTVRWSPPRQGAENVQRYHVKYWKTESEECPKIQWSNTNHATLTHLMPNATYQVRVQAWCEVGFSPQLDITVSTRPACPPEQLTVYVTSPETVHFRWAPPKLLGAGCSIQNYVITQETKTGNEDWITLAYSQSDTCYLKASISPQSPKKFTVAAICKTGGQSRYSQPNDGVVNNDSHVTRDLKRATTRASKVAKVGPPSFYQLPLRHTVRGSESTISRYEFGKFRKGMEKIILLVGETGAGKTTLVNALTNFVFGVKWGDSFRFTLVTEDSSCDQSMSQTIQVTAYTLHYQNGFQVPYTLTIIDTPGFGSTGGVTHDDEIMTQIQRFLMTRGSNCVDFVSAVGFVVSANQPKLTPTQRYIFSQIISIFGTDITENSFLFFTFADAKKPESLSSIKKGMVPFKRYFKFNNYFLTLPKNDSEDCRDDDGDQDFNRLFWNMGQNSCKKVLESVAETKDILLTHT